MHLSKRTIRNLVIAAAILAVPFVWNENPCLSCKLNYEKLAAYFGILAAIGTTASLYLLYQQVYLSRKQHQPNIVVEETVFYVGYDSSGNVIAAYEDLESKTPLGYPTMNVTNSGTATAFKIHVELDVFNKNPPDKLPAFMEFVRFVSLKEKQETKFQLTERAMLFIDKLSQQISEDVQFVATHNTYDVLLTVTYTDNDNYNYSKKFNVEIYLLHYKPENRTLVRFILNRIRER